MASQNPKVMLAGVLAGVLVVFAFFSGLAATGFAVAVGDQTMNFRQTFTEDTILPLTLPENITSFRVTGTYRGSGEVRVHLIGPDQSWLVAAYDAPQVQLNSTFVLERGGTVVQLSEDDRLNHTHIFEDVCDQTCSEDLSGPFHLQIVVREGQFTLSSASYTTPQVLTRPSTPTQDPDETIEIPETEPVPRQNPPPECSQSTSSQRCLEEYFISPAGHLNITDSQGRLVALFDRTGRVLLAGDIIEQTQSTPPSNAFRIQNRWGDIAWVTDQGDLHLTGRLVESVDSVPLSGAENFVIRNPDEIVLVVQGATGDLFSRSTLVAGVLS